jgi:putative DNA primase/helicase
MLGKWPGIFRHFGIRVGNGNHGPCPVCGGRDRFRFDDRGGKGTWICNQCGAGNGWELLRRVFNCSFEEALEKVQPIVGDIPKQKRRPGMSDEKRREALIELWKSSVPIKIGDPVYNYLQSRGLKAIPENVRYCATCYNKDENRYMDAMIANFMGPAGKGVTIHRTYLENDRKANIEKPKKLMPHAGEMAGGAVRLFQYKDVLGIAEGIETAIAATQLFDIPTWAALSAGMLEQWEPPDGVEQVIVFGDRDERTFTGQKSAYVLANRLAIKGMNVNVEIPMSTGDWADQVEG